MCAYKCSYNHRLWCQYTALVSYIHTATSAAAAIGITAVTTTSAISLQTSAASLRNGSNGDRTDAPTCFGLPCTPCSHCNTKQQPYRALLQCLSDMSSETKKRFLNFVLGCPTLPPGGLNALLPPLEISRKQGSAGAFASEEQVKKDLPFARTCTHTVSFVQLYSMML
jgi:HECT-domain (ubiquitin-transferase)